MKCIFLLAQSDSEIAVHEDHGRYAVTVSNTSMDSHRRFNFVTIHEALDKFYMEIDTLNKRNAIVASA
jgi:hypothetical protein